MEHHIDRHFDKALDSLKEQILRMGGKVEAMLADSIRALADRDSDLAKDMEERDKEIDGFEMAVDDHCLEILACYQPAGRDLRFVSRGLKIATDLERIGDLALNTANRVREILGEGAAPIDLREMSGIVQGMLRDALDAFVKTDVAKAEAMLSQDDAVDAMTERFVTELVDRSIREPQHLKRYFPAASIVRYLERIADHATNIAEITIFVAKGCDVRHGHFHSFP